MKNTRVRKVVNSVKVETVNLSRFFKTEPSKRLKLKYVKDPIHIEIFRMFKLNSLTLRAEDLKLLSISEH